MCKRILKKLYKSLTKQWNYLKIIKTNKKKKDLKVKLIMYILKKLRILYAAVMTIKDYRLLIRLYHIHMGQVLGK